MWSELDDNETIIYHYVHELRSPLRNLLGIFRGQAIQQDTLDMKNYEITRIDTWVNQNSNLSLTGLREKIIQNSIISFTDQKTLKLSLAIEYYKHKANAFEEIKEFLRYDYNIVHEEDFQRIIQRKSKEDRDFFVKDLEKYRTLEAIKQELASYPSFPASEITYEKIKYECMPKLHGQPVINPDNGIKLFDDFVCDENVSFIYYQTKDPNIGFLSKVYLDMNMNANLIKNKSEPLKGWERKPNTFFFVLSAYDSYATLDLETGKLFIETTSDAEKLVIKFLENATKMSLGQLSKVSISGSFKVYGLEVIEPIFFDMILQEKLLSDFLLYDEFDNYYPIKKKFFYHFKLPLLEDFAIDTNIAMVPANIPFEKSLTFFISQESLPNGSWIKNYRQKLEKLENPEGHDIPYLIIRFFRSFSEDFTKQFFFKINKLLRYYDQHQSQTIAIYKKFFPESSLFIKRKIKRQKVPRVKKLKILQIYDPELFPKRYARRCQEKRQPTILTEPEEIEKWKQETFLFGDQIRHREVLEYPLVNNTPKWHFICPSNEYPFPGLRINKDLPNKDKYPYIPCCFEKPQMDPGLKTHYNEWKTEKPKKTLSSTTATKSTNEHRMVTNKALLPGRTAYVPPLLEFFIKNTEEVEEVYRYGVPISPNSLIHCILEALHVREYKQSRDKEKFVLQLRATIAKTIETSLCKQELYEYNLEEIKEMIQGQLKYFDSAFLYRALEEFFKVNIFVFLFFPAYFWDILRTSSADKMVSMEIPRHKFFYIRRINLERPTIVIFKHTGAESDSLKYPQCEIIGTEKGLTMSKKTAIELYRAFRRIFRVYRWNNELGMVRFPVFSLIEFMDNLIKNRLIQSQMVDRIGKARAFILRNGITLVIPPTRPENFPLSTTINRTKLTDVLQFINSEISGYSTRDGKLIGVWYGQYFEGIYVPLIPQEVPSEFKKLPEHPEILLRESDVEPIHKRYSRYRKSLHSFLQCCLWLFQILHEDWDRFEKLFEIVNISPMENVDFSKLPKDLPNVQNISEAMEHLKKYVPEIFRNGTIRIPNDHIKKSILYFLRLYQQTITDKSRIKALDWTSTDFKQRFMNRILPSLSLHARWIRGVFNSIDTNLYPKFDISLTLEKQYFTRIKHVVCLIYRITVPLKDEEALLIAKIWDKEGIVVNKKYLIREFEEKYGKFDMTTESYIIFRFLSGELVEETKNKNGRYWVIRLFTDNFAVALKLT